MWHWHRGRCWCGGFHREEATTLPLADPPQVTGRPKFDVAREVAERVN